MAQLAPSPPHKPNMARSSARQRTRVEELRTKQDAREAADKVVANESARRRARTQELRAKREVQEAAAKAAAYGQDDFFESLELLALLHVIPLSFYDIDWEDQVLSHRQLMLAKGVPKMF
ncbi:hypothetical protein EV175_003795 [Coemansia sp. RSA 1933]|nr:hypothetical protein EV175_003795 [Coemansia sp. RSA 1933]